MENKLNQNGENSKSNQISNKKAEVLLPEGFEKCLIDFTVDVIKEKPSNVIKHAVKYFTEKLKTIQVVDDDDESSDSGTKASNTKKVRINLDEIGEISNTEYFAENLIEDLSIDTNKKDVKFRRNSIFTRTYNPDEDNEDVDYDNESDKLNEDNKAKSPEIRKKLEEILRSIIMFKHLCEEDFNQILDNMFEKRCSANEVIIKEGDDGNYFYVIDQGTYEIYKNENYVKKIGEYKNSGYFGELALLYNQPRLATIISVEPNGILWAMNRDTFRRLVISNAFKRRKAYEEFLRSVPLLRECLNDYERIQVADSLTSVTLKKNDCIIKAGDLANGMYFIEEGQVKIIVDCKNKEFNEIILNKGDYFGEIALIKKIHRSASVYCLSETLKLAFLEIEVFERLMGPCIDVFKKNLSNYRFAKDDD